MPSTVVDRLTDRQLASLGMREIPFTAVTALLDAAGVTELDRQSLAEVTINRNQACLYFYQRDGAGRIQTGTHGQALSECVTLKIAYDHGPTVDAPPSPEPAILAESGPMLDVAKPRDTTVDPGAAPPTE